MVRKKVTLWWKYRHHGWSDLSIVLSKGQGKKLFNFSEKGIIIETVIHIESQMTKIGSKHLYNNGYITT